MSTNEQRKMDKMRMMNRIWVLWCVLLWFTVGGLGEQCGSQAGGALCPNNMCCSRYGWYGSTHEYCGPDCQSQCGRAPTPSGGGLRDILSGDTFNQMLKHRDDDAFQARGFYTYDAFIQAAQAFPSFATTGYTSTRKREVAAFLGQTSHETTGGWAAAPDDLYAWGYCYKQEWNPSNDYCASSSQYPCAPGKQYYGRGPIQLSWYTYITCMHA